jgi:HPt (histidine-containing phosphotransfer) domain-containing protein
MLKLKANSPINLLTVKVRRSWLIFDLVDESIGWRGCEHGCAMDDLTREFLIESQEGLDRMERCLTELESKPSDTGLLAEIFRTVHTIKGTTGFLGFKRLEKLAHSGENLLGLLREGKLAADGQVITGLLQLQDGLRRHGFEVDCAVGGVAGAISCRAARARTRRARGRPGSRGFAARR